MFFQFQTRDEIIDGNHRLISSNDQNARSSATAVVILLYLRRIGRVKKNMCMYGRLMTVDLKLSRRIFHILVVYHPNLWNYDLHYF